MRKFFQIAIASLIALSVLCACDSNTKTRRTVNMTALSPRLQPLFEKTKPICFGRFMIDVPVATEVIWGSTDVPLGVNFYKGQAGRLDEVVSKREMALKAEPRYPMSKNLNLYFETIGGVAPGMKIVISQQDFSSTGMLRMDSYLTMGADLVELSARPLEKHRSETIALLNSMARRLRPQAEAEIPSEPGQCLENSFLPDGQHQAGRPDSDDSAALIGVGFRLKEFPDVHLSIYVAPANEYNPQSDSLEQQMKETEDLARKAGEGDPYAKITFFRRDKRVIHDWQTGFEVLTRTPKEEGALPHDDFWLKFTGVGNDPFRPYADIQMKTGVDNDAAGATASSLSDDEAIALWDKLTSSIRVRPTTKAVKTSDATTHQPPLGKFAATGRTCPQTGWWQCDQQGDVQGGRRQFFREGDWMPRVVVRSEPKLWQKLKGETPMRSVATMWELVERSVEPPLAEADQQATSPLPPKTDES